MIKDQDVQQRMGQLPLGFDNHVFCVPAGTEIEHQGKRLTVTDTSVVWLHNRVYCTHPLFDLIKAQTAKRLS